MTLDREQFERLALEQLDCLYRVAQRLTHSAERAGDLVQETYLRALRGYRTFELKEHGIRPWMVRIMHNLHFTERDRAKRQPAATETPVLESGVREGTADPYAYVPAGWDGMDERLVRAVNELPEEYRLVLLLWAVEDFSYKEIAEAADVPLGTVMSRLHRARHRLAERLHGFASEQRLIRE